MKGSAQPDFSFSGLKTAVRQAATAIAPLSDQDVADICASFQAAVADALADRVSRALARFRETFPRHSKNPRRWSWPAASPPTSTIKAMLSGSAARPACLHRAAAETLHRQCAR
jgi:tRNA A37 threonylcarbamoyltransferase TsaD